MSTRNERGADAFSAGTNPSPDAFLYFPDGAYRWAVRQAHYRSAVALSLFPLQREARVLQVRHQHVAGRMGNAERRFGVEHHRLRRDAASPEERQLVGLHFGRIAGPWRSEIFDPD